jgi:hypothetical protein
MNKNVKIAYWSLFGITLILAILGLVLTKDWGGFLINLSAELLGTFIIVTIIILVFEDRKQEEVKSRLLREMGSEDNAEALAAARELKEKGWMADGSLAGKNFYSANLAGALLTDANCKQAVFVSANLTKATLYNANFAEAVLIYADLSGASMNGINLTNSRLHRAKLDGAILVRANFKDSDITDHTLHSAAELRYATLPDGTKYDGRFRLPAELEMYASFYQDEDTPENWAEFYDISVEEYLEGQAWTDKNLK